MAKSSKDSTARRFPAGLRISVVAVVVVRVRGERALEHERLPALLTYARNCWNVTRYSSRLRTPWSERTLYRDRVPDSRRDIHKPNSKTLGHYHRRLSLLPFGHCVQNVLVRTFIHERTQQAVLLQKGFRSIELDQAARVEHHLGTMRAVQQSRRKARSQFCRNP